VSLHFFPYFTENHILRAARCKVAYILYGGGGTDESDELLHEVTGLYVERRRALAGSRDKWTLTRRFHAAFALMGRENWNRFDQWLRWRGWLFHERARKRAEERGPRERMLAMITKRKRSEEDAMKTLEVEATIEDDTSEAEEAEVEVE